MIANITDTQLSPYRMKLRVMLDNRRWIATHIDELMKKYQSKWVVVTNGAVIAHGDTAEGAIAACENEIDDVETVVLLVPDLIPRPI